MQFLRNRLIALVALVALAWLVTPALAAPIGEPRPKNDSTAERVRKALDQVVDVKIENVTLDKAIEQLRDAHKINLILDRVATAGMVTVDPMTNLPITVSLDQSNVKLRTALRLLLGQFHLTYAIIGETVVVTTEEAALTRQLRQRVSIDLDKEHLATALKRLARDTSTNLLVDPRVSKEAESPVTLQLEDVPLETAVRLMAEVSGLKTVRVGNVLFVTNKSSAAEMRAEPELVPPMKTGNTPDELVVPGVGIVPPGKVIVPVPAPAVPAGADKAADKKETNDEPKKPDSPKETEKQPDPKPEKK
jgi:hypothetical protein